MGTEEQLLAVTPIDGRYGDKVQELQPITSEYGLIKRRVTVEVGWLSVLSSGVLPDVEPLNDLAQDYLRNVPDTFSPVDAAEVKAIEKTTNHDVKAVEVWLRQKLQGAGGSFNDYLELIHFGCTSEDINNLAYAMMYRDARNEVLLPNLYSIQVDLEDKAQEYAPVPMLARTHGQPATPTTLGKEMAVFASRLSQSQARLKGVDILGKFSGATGNYNAVMVAYPDIWWPDVAQQFISGLGFEMNPVTTQIEPHDWMAVFSSEVALGNTILTDLARDMWTYISMGYFTQQVKAGEVGSSTMPHKVNPIDFENSESNFATANALLVHLAAKLPISRLQRDLSDSSTQRVSGEAFGHTLIGYKALLRGLGKVIVNETAISTDLENEWNILAEAVQTVMRRYGLPDAYDVIKHATRGRELERETYEELVNGLSLPVEAKEVLLGLTPSQYLGLARAIARGEMNP